MLKMRNRTKTNTKKGESRQVKKYLVEWETCYCEESTDEISGAYTVDAENEKEAEKSFNRFHSVITKISEVNNKC